MTFTQVSSPILQISITSPATGNYINIANSPEFNVSGNCPQNGETISVTAGDGSQSVNAKTACASGSYSTTLDLTALFDGSITITADRVDVAENVLTRTSVGVTKDTVAPDAPTAVTLLSPATSPSQSATPTIRVEGTTLDDGTHTLTNDLVVSIYTDSGCSLPALKGEGKPTNGSFVDITSDSLDEGFYYFYAMATDPAGNPSDCSSVNHAFVAYARDITPPFVTSIAQASPALTSASSVGFTVAFSESVTGVIAGNFALTTTGNITSPPSSITGVVSVSGSLGRIYTVTVDTGSGSGTIRLDLTSAANIRDQVSNALTTTSYTGPTYTIDKTAPTIVSIKKKAGQLDPTNAATTQYTVTFSEPIIGLSNSNFSVATTNGTFSLAPTIANLSSTLGTTIDVTVNTGTPSAPSATLRLDLSTVTGITDNVGNSLAAPKNGDQTITIDNIAPTITIGPPSIPSVNSSGTVSFTVNYSGTDTISLTAGDITLAGSGASCLTSVTISGSTSATVTLSTCTGNGTLQINVAANSAKDYAGNFAPAAGPSASFTVDNTGPTATLSINAGAPNTAFRDVTLSLGASDPNLPISTCIAEANSCSGCTAYTQTILPTQVPFQLSSGVALKYVSVSYKDAVGNSTCVTSSITLKTLSLAVSPLYPTYGAKWNNYVKSSSTPSIEASCVGDETGANPCIHGGEKRKVLVDTENSCAGLAMTDNNQVFNWACSDNNGAGPVEFRSSLKQGKGLRDLLNSSTPAWLPKSVTLTKSGSSDTFSSTAVAWWTNPITSLSSWGSLQSISHTLAATDSRIYAIPNGAVIATAYGVQFGANNVALVTLGNSALVWDSTGVNNCAATTPNKKCLLFTPSSGAKSFLWIEGIFTGTTTSTDDYGIYFFGTSFSKIVNTQATLMNTGIYFESSNENSIQSTTVGTSGIDGISLNNSNYNLIQSSNISGSALDGIRITSSSNNTVQASSSFSNILNGIELINSASNSLLGLRLTNNGQDGMNLNNSSSINNIVSEINTSNNGGTGIHVSATTMASNNNFSRVIAFANGGSGIKFESISDGNRVSTATLTDNFVNGIELNNSWSNILLNVVSANNGIAGLKLNDARTNTISQSAFAHNTTGVVVSDSSFGSYGNLFSNSFLYGNNGTDCSDATTSLTTNYGASGIASNCTANGNSTFTAVITNLSLGSAFAGMVTTPGDSVNTSDSNGTATYSASLDWLGFMNFFRGWGLNGSSFANADDRGRCITGTCRIWDWSLNKDTVSPAFTNSIWNRTGDGSNANSTTFAVPVLNVLQACPSETNGDQTITSVSVIKYLKNAVEIIGDGIGNDNGLCETGDNCLYTPNFGAYQGHDSSGNNKLYECAFTPTSTAGHLSSIRIFGYDTNGY